MTGGDPIRRTMDAGQWAMLLTLSLLWGGSFFFGKVALAGMGMELVAQFAVLGAALSYACAGIFGRRFDGRPPWSPPPAR